MHLAWCAWRVCFCVRPAIYEALHGSGLCEFLFMTFLFVFIFVAQFPFRVIASYVNLIAENVPGWCDDAEQR